jgi:hypothetical protein
MSSPVKTVTIRGRVYRLPFIDLIPFSGAQNNDLGADIQEAGEVEVAVVCWKEQTDEFGVTVVDGAHRAWWAAEHKLDNLPVRYKSFASELEAKVYCFRVNGRRRHLTEGELEQANRTRVELEVALRRSGESLRAIAGKVGVSHEQVRRDLGASTVTGVTVEPPDGTVKGRDSRRRPSRRRPTGERQPGDEPPPLCARCRRIGVATCPACQDAGAKAPPAKAGQPPFDWKQLEAAFGPVARFPEAVVKAHPQERGGEEAQEAVRLLEALAQLIKAWKAKLGGRRP